MVQVHPGKRGKYGNASTGSYLPLNPQKYRGKYPLVFKSSLEHKMMLYLDRTSSIIEWTYEPQYICYFDKARNKVRHYYIDFTAVIQYGSVKRVVWLEIKPESETHPPRNKSNVQAMMTWITNQSKWEAAQKLAKSKGYEFHVITEKQLD